LVLAVDDDRTVLEEVTGVLSRVNLGCHCCTTSEEALLAVQTTTPDLILCDINLNGESGLELCERIKQQPDFENVPVMFLSGAQLPDIIRRNFNAGGTYCLRKPFDSTVLIELIDQALGATEV
jgi:CheY-like chemotaxis protein